MRICIEFFRHATGTEKEQHAGEAIYMNIVYTDRLRRDREHKSSDDLCNALVGTHGDSHA